jgi:hypothetical protein
VGKLDKEPHFDRQLKDLFASLTQLLGGFAVLDPMVVKHLQENGYDTKEKFIEWLYKSPEEASPHFNRISDINIVVTGGQTNLYYQYGGMRYDASASVDKWR